MGSSDRAGMLVGVDIGILCGIPGGTLDSGIIQVVDCWNIARTRRVSDFSLRLVLKKGAPYDKREMRK